MVNTAQPPPLPNRSPAPSLPPSCRRRLPRRRLSLRRPIRGTGRRWSSCRLSGRAPTRCRWGRRATALPLVTQLHAVSASCLSSRAAAPATPQATIPTPTLPHPGPQAERDAVAAELAEARSRYAIAVSSLEAERARSAMLEVCGLEQLDGVWGRRGWMACTTHICAVRWGCALAGGGRARSASASRADNAPAPTRATPLIRRSRGRMRQPLSLRVLRSGIARWVGGTFMPGNKIDGSGVV